MVVKRAFGIILFILYIGYLFKNLEERKTTKLVCFGGCLAQNTNITTVPFCHKSDPVPGNICFKIEKRCCEHNTEKCLEFGYRVVCKYKNICESKECQQLNLAMLFLLGSVGILIVSYSLYVKETLDKYNNRFKDQ